MKTTVSWVVLIKKKKKSLHKEMFHLSEMFLSAKEEDHRGHFKVPLHHIWPEKLCCVHTGLTLCRRCPEGTCLSKQLVVMLILCLVTMPMLI